jgi:3-deoxy-manno-octulosonate cytidylyltransferase (CMP-KDO synthetase)
LIAFNQLDEGILEKIESIDMNRLLELGKKIRMVEVNGPMIGVDTQIDLNAAEALMVEDTVYPKYSKI